MMKSSHDELLRVNDRMAEPVFALLQLAKGEKYW
jgi:hypothetical protein